MDPNEDKMDELVEAKVELTGSYERIAEIISENGSEKREFTDIFEDFKAILATIDRLEGGTRSRIASELPESTSIDIDGENVIDILRVLELYGIVELDQYTWRRASADGE